MPLCVQCTQSTLITAEICSHHESGHGDDWATANRIMCDFRRLNAAPTNYQEQFTRSVQNGEENTMQLQSDYLTAYHNLKLTRDRRGVLVAEFHSNGGPFTMTAQSHTEFVDAFYRIGQDRANKIVILTGAGEEFITDVAWSSFGDVADPGVWSQVHDEGVQVLENIANIRVPVIAAIEGRAHVHSDYALLASVIVAAEGATFQDVAHFAAGVAPGDGIFTTWSYRAGAGRAEAFLLNPQPLAARTAKEWGVVAEVVPNGKALSRARELAELYLKAPEVTRRNTRVHFIQPLKERIVREVGYGLSLEGASSAALVKSIQAKSEPVAEKRKSAIKE
jgi:enoyl-CoA hydratase/carnithine racemase